MIKNLPNILTISRILCIPLIILSFYIYKDSRLSCILSASIFIYAGITDFLDGYIARVWSTQSKLGKFLDPIADKLLIASTILMLLHFNRVDIFPALAIICREILVSGLREFLAEIRVSMPVSKLAKIKTTLQIGAIFALLLGSKGSNIEILDFVGRVALWIAAVLTLFTGYIYLNAGLKHMAKKGRR